MVCAEDDALAGFDEINVIFQQTQWLRYNITNHWTAGG